MKGRRPVRSIAPDVEEGRRLALFLDRIIKNITVTEAGCWEWQLYIDSRGYGMMWDGVLSRRAHQVSYGIIKGEVPEGLEIDHLCRNRRCCNPHHLEAVTHAENVRRGTFGAVAAINNKERFRRQTHCKRGHEFTPENTRIYIVAKGYRTRICRACRVVLKRGYRANQRAAA